MSSMALLSFAKDIRPLFRDTPDVDSMKKYGLDLSSYEEVKAQSAAILASVEGGSIPCDDPWPKEQVDLLRQWIKEGMAP